MWSYSFVIEKIPQKGEDAPPTLLIDQDNKVGILSVYDGLGGSGSTLYTLGASERTGAFIASRLARQVTERLFANNTPQLRAFVARLQQELATQFQFVARQLGAKPSFLKSKLIRRLPTTIAGATFYFPSPPYTKIPLTYDIEAFWAGDSRIYLLSAKGLQQLSNDDITPKQDALENLLEDSLITNCINAEGDFQIHSKQFLLEGPALLIAATDGAFNYVPSPAHFEYLLLKTLFLPGICHPEQWGQALKKHLSQIAADDVSLALVHLGFEHLQQLQKVLIDRFIFLKQTYIDPLGAQETATEQSWSQATRHLRQELWDQYKKEYYLA